MNSYKALAVIVLYVIYFVQASPVEEAEEQYSYTPTNYDISRNRQLGNNIGFGLSQILDYILGNYNQYGYPGYYPQGPGGYPGQYPGQYGGNYNGGNYPSGNYPSENYPNGNYPIGPPGAHPGCPLCDSSVYSYCSRKQAHDSCCCDGNSYYSYCRKRDCNYLHANSCQEYRLISNCCCIDVQKNAVAAPIAPVAVTV